MFQERESINITVINPLFMVVFLGTAIACIFLTISSVLRLHQSGAVYVIVSSLLYLISTVLVTIVFNVPLNDALANVNPSSTDSANLWVNYLAN